MTLSETPPVINCYECGRVYRMDRDCPNCERRYRRELTQRNRARKLTFEQHLELQPHLTAWLRNNRYLTDIEEAWPSGFRARLNKYGLTPMGWAELVVRYEAACQICRTPAHPLKLHIDHDHTNGHVRGLLCNRCNTGIGMLRIDGPEGAKRAAAVRAYISSAYTRR